jgi:WhiB family transcriptional regulator, redox-sensing transcriptional regulator
MSGGATRVASRSARNRGHQVEYDKPSPSSWRDLAACRDVDPETFFPIGTTDALGQLREARAICGRCPVAADCLDWALRVGQDHGVWGGTTPEERRALRTVGDRTP